MRAKDHGDLTVFIVLVLVVRGVETGLPAPYEVSVTCDSYGVVLDWKASGLSPDAGFLLELVPDHGDKIQLKTSSRRYNISTNLTDVPFNRYVVNMKAIKGTEESDTVSSKIFTYNYYERADIRCDLEFPDIHLSPGDHQLTLRFVNPLHLYGHTPALKNLTIRRLLGYRVASSNEETNNLTFECFPERDMCESNVLFPEKQEEYCVTLSGFIGQIRVRETNPQCYRGSLEPSAPVSMYVVPLAGLLAACGVLLFLRLLSMAIKKKSLEKFPKILEFFLMSKHPNTLLKIETEAVVENPSVETTTFLQTDSPEISALLDVSSLSSEESDSHSCDPGENYTMETSGSFSSTYDCPHRPVEMSPGDLVESYGP